MRNFIKIPKPTSESIFALRKLCESAEPEEESGYVSIEVTSTEMAQSLYDALKKEEERLRAIYDEIEESGRPGRPEGSAAAAGAAVNDAVAAEDEARALLLRLESEDEA